MKRIATGLIALMALAGGAAAQRGGQVSPECRRQIVQLCGFDRAAMRQCLVERGRQLSRSCIGELRGRMGPEARPAEGGRELSYGADPRQRLDFWPAPGKTNAPLIVFIHGGGWAIGDKGHSTGSKMPFYTGQGYAFASVNYRLVPAVGPGEQAVDVAGALARLRLDAAKLGIDPDRIVIMGHSAGAHLAALISADTSYLERAGVPIPAVRGTILLDGAGYDVAKQMAYKSNQVQFMYDAAFGNDPAVQKQLSPIAHASTPNVPRWLILHVATRPDARDQSESLGRALSAAGAQVTVKAVPGSTHMTVNRDSGVAGTVVGDAITAFLKEAL